MLSLGGWYSDRVYFWVGVGWGGVFRGDFSLYEVCVCVCIDWGDIFFVGFGVFDLFGGRYWIRYWIRYGSGCGCGCGGDGLIWRSRESFLFCCVVRYFLRFEMRLLKKLFY